MGDLIRNAYRSGAYNALTGKPPIVRKPPVFEPTVKGEGDVELRPASGPWWRK